MTADSDLSRRALSGVLWSVVRFGSTQLLAFLVFGVLGRLLTEEDFGVVAIAMAFVMVGDILAQQGVADFIVQDTSLTDERASTAFWLNLGLSCALAAGFAAVAGWVGQYFDDPRLPAVLRWLSLSVVIRSVSVVQTGYLMREMRFGALAVRAVIVAVAGGAAAVVAALAGLGAEALIVQELVAASTSAVVLWTASHWRPGLRFSASGLREILAFGSGLLGAAMLRVVGARFDQLVLGATLGTGTVGFYSMARKITELVTRLVVKSGDSVAFSAFSRLKEDREAALRGYYGAMRFASLVSLPAFALLGVLSRPLVVLLLGPRWEEAAPILSVLCVGGLMLSGSYIAGSMIKATGATHFILMVHVGITVVNVVGALLLYRYGPLAIAAVYVASVAVVRPLELYFLRRKCGVRLRHHLQEVGPAAVSAGLAAGAAYAVTRLTIDLHLAVTAGGGAIVGTATYMGALALLFPAQFRSVRELLDRILARLRRRRNSATNHATNRDALPPDASS